MTPDFDPDKLPRLETETLSLRIGCDKQLRVYFRLDAGEPWFSGVQLPKEDLPAIGRFIREVYGE